MRPWMACIGTSIIGGSLLAVPLLIALATSPLVAIPTILLGTGLMGISMHLALQRWRGISEPLQSKGNAWCRIDTDGRILEFRGHSLQFLGIDNQTVATEQPPFERFVPDGADLSHIDDNPIAVQRGDDNLIAVHALLCDPRPIDGPERWLHLRDITDDITRQGELMEAEAELRLVFNTIEECVLLLDLDGTVTTANAAARETYGQDLPGQDVHQVLRREGEPGPEAALQSCMANFTPVTLEQHLSSQNRTVEVHVYPIYNSRGALRQLLYLERDITSQRLMELELQVQHRRIQDSLVRMREVDQAKTKWLNSVSHELRTPLTSIRSYSELLLTYPDTDNETRCEFASVIARESERLTRLINDLLDLAAIESGNLQLHLVDLDVSALVHECGETLAALAGARSVQIEIDAPAEPLPIRSDRDRLFQVFVNLVSNAIKFSPESGRVLIHCRRSGQELRFTVEDEGPGIAVADRRKVFRSFTQLNSNLTDKPTGTGLGLTISGELMGRLGGTLRCSDPQFLCGACFLGVLPLTGPSTSEPT